MSAACACGQPSVMKTRPLCAMHYRFGQMRATAKRRGKYVPSVTELSELLDRGMRCEDCGAAMNWLVRDGRLTALSLQHYRDGSLGFVCVRCNVRHGLLPGDSYREVAALFQAQPGEKLCTRCMTAKPVDSFHADKRRAQQRKAWCKQCSSEVSRELWKRKAAA